MKRKGSVNAIEFREVSGEMELLLAQNLLESAFSPMQDREAAEKFITVAADIDKFWVLDIDGAVSGCLSISKVKHKAGVWLLNNLCVASFWRKGGLARFMLTKCLEYLAEQNCRALIVMLHPELIAAEKLFLGVLEFTAVRVEENTGIYLATLKFE